MPLRQIVRTVVPPPGPIRPFAAANLVRTVGSGLLLALSTLYFTQFVGLTPAKVGLGLSLSAAAAVAAGVPAGRAADLLGPRRLTILFTVLQGLAVACYVFASGFWSFVLVSSVAAALLTATNAARFALVAAAVPRESRVEARAYMRVISNVGVSAGAAAGGLALYSDSSAVYRWMFLTSGAALCASALFYLQTPAGRGGPARHGDTLHSNRLQVFRDKPYVAVSLLNAVLATHDAILTVALPIWIARETQAPVWVYSAVILINTVLVVLLQVRVSRTADDVAGSARALARSGLWVAGSCVLFAAASWPGRGVAVVLLLVGAAVHVVGELLQSAGSWGLAYELAPEHAQGEYQGMFGTSLQLAGIVTPAVATLLLVGWGVPGWILLAAVLAGVGVTVPAVSSWAARRPLPGGALVLGSET